MRHVLRVLMVQDAADAELAARELGNAGLRLEHRVVASDAAFRDALRTFRPHIILAEYALPGWDGLAALEFARRSAPEAPFIFFCAPLGEERAVEAMRRGAADCVVKSRIAALTPAIQRASAEAAKRHRRRVAERRLRRREQRLRALIDTAYRCDPLTGLANRALYCRRLDERLRATTGPESAFAVAAFDVHNLSVINDTCGRRVGDALLQRLAERLRAHVREEEERIGYLGGGTFALVIPQLGAAEENAARLLESPIFNEQFSIEDRTVRASFRCGIAYSGHAGDDGGMLVQKAEAALAEAKRSGETLMLYREQMHREIAERLALEHRLRIALEERQFELHYQPQMELATGRIRAVEALLRWRDPERGMIAPGEFLPVLESSGLIVPVGRWVLEQAVQDCRRFCSAGIGPLRVGVNVSAIQIRRRTFIEQTLELVSGLPREGGIEVEITETGLLQDLDTSRRRLERLRAAGVRIAVDDFGTGYSSLALLPRLPIDALKIDRSFIHGLPDDRASVTLVSSIVGLARAFGLEAVAEGVESPGQLEVLRTLECARSQGFLHGRPVPRDEIERMLLSSADGAAPIRN